MTCPLTYRLIPPDDARVWPHGLVAVTWQDGTEVLFTKEQIGELTIVINHISSAMKQQYTARPRRHTAPARYAGLADDIRQRIAAHSVAGTEGTDSDPA